MYNIRVIFCAQTQTPKPIFPNLLSPTNLTVRLINGVRHNTSISQTLPRPVILELALTINTIHSVQHLSVPESTTRGILLVSVNLSIVESLSIAQSVIVKGLERPLANEDREFAVTLADVLCLTANGCRDVLRVCSSGGEEVDVRVDHKIRTGRVERTPEHFAKERILKHQRNSLINFCDSGENALDIGVNPVDSSISKTSRCSKACKVVAGLVDRCDGESVLATRGLDESQDGVNSLEAVIKVGAVLEPSIVAKGFSDGQSVDTAR